MGRVEEIHAGADRGLRRSFTKKPDAAGRLAAPGPMRADRRATSPTHRAHRPWHPRIRAAAPRLLIVKDLLNLRGAAPGRPPRLSAQAPPRRFVTMEHMPSREE